ncbi:MAG: 50S ribosomal protein L25 [Candidatus Calescibacterium sp.]|nr:50S ribosomal protein L25 [Candidatus Calescibacterium sp.]MDW8132389.1 50S ribosomal protein L25 [Candidatus Calescibacterium sp.]
MLATLTKAERESIIIEASNRNHGKVESKNIRHKGFVPACLYGKDIQNKTISISLKDATKLRTGQIVQLKIDGDYYRSVVKEIQYDYLKDKIIHVDFMALVEGRFIEIEVPLEITGESQGVKKGGILQVLLNTLKLKVLPNNIPEKIVLNVTNLDIGDSIHVSDLVNIEEFKGIKFVNRADTTIVTVTSAEEKTE